MLILGWFLFGFGLLLLFASNLQHTDFLILLPSYILIVCGAGFLGLADWRCNKNSHKKISMLAILCFIFGLMGFLIQEDITCLTVSLSSMILGIIFKIKDKKEPGKLMGNSLFIAGIILSGIIMFITLLLLLIAK